MEMSHIGNFFGNSYMAFYRFYLYLIFLMTATNVLFVSQTVRRE